MRFLPASFSARVPHVPALDGIVAGSGGLLEYERASEELRVNGKLDEHRYRQLLASYPSLQQRAAVHPILRKLHEDSKLYVTDDELHSLETFARRIREEIFFARKWLMVEGQAEYLIVHALARALDYSLDEYGIALIDVANNGNPALFAVLARAYGIPWRAVLDGDEEGLRKV